MDLECQYCTTEVSFDSPYLVYSWFWPPLSVRGCLWAFGVKLTPSKMVTVKIQTYRSARGTHVYLQMCRRFLDISTPRHSDPSSGLFSYQPPHLGFPRSVISSREPFVECSQGLSLTSPIVAVKKNWTYQSTSGTHIPLLKCRQISYISSQRRNLAFPREFRVGLIILRNRLWSGSSDISNLQVERIVRWKVTGRPEQINCPEMHL